MSLKILVTASGTLCAAAIAMTAVAVSKEEAEAKNRKSKATLQVLVNIEAGKKGADALKPLADISPDWAKAVETAVETQKKCPKPSSSVEFAQGFCFQP